MQRRRSALFLKVSRWLPLPAGRTSRLLNFSTLAADTGITRNTAKVWISVLQASYLLFLLRPPHVRFSRRLIEMPKLYFYDVGLVSWLLGIRTEEQMETHPLRGSIFKTMVIAEMLYGGEESYVHKGILVRGWREIDTLFP